MSSVTSVYGPLLISLFFSTILHGIGIIQCGLYCQWSWSIDGWSVKSSVLIVTVVESMQLFFFWRSMYFRLVERFGIPEENLIWSDSCQLLANYLTACVAQMHFASRIYHLTKKSVRMHTTSRVGIYVVIALGITQMVAGIVQTVLSHTSMEAQTKAITVLQMAASLGIKNTLNTLIINVLSRGIFTIVSSALTMIMFLIRPGDFYFVLSLAPSSELHMNSLLASLNMREYMRNKSTSDWETVVLEDQDVTRGGDKPIGVLSIRSQLPPESHSSVSWACVKHKTAEARPRDSVEMPRELSVRNLRPNLARRCPGRRNVKLTTAEARPQDSVEMVPTETPSSRLGIRRTRGRHRLSSRPQLLCRGEFIVDLEIRHTRGVCNLRPDLSHCCPGLCSTAEARPRDSVEMLPAETQSLRLGLAPRAHSI
ncbi:hypothetical protein DFH06DRAFT_1350069 [Mycena polygramma]|nr:hypothetical protein DFH06DRAFT_1350069 [Mycena polygramma]